MKKLLTVLVIVLLGIATQPAGAAIMDTFESGYSAGSLDGQNGWLNYIATGLSVDNTYGEGGGWGAYDVWTSPDSYVGSKKAHGEPMTNGDVLTLSLDVAASSPNAQSRIVLRDIDGGASYLLVSLNFGASGSIALEGAGAQAISVSSSQNVATQWHHVELNWTIGSSVSAEVWDASSTLVFSSGAQTYTGLENLSGLHLYTRYGGTNAFDNISVSEIPEPATLGVLGFGLLGFLIRRKR